jgi:membrane-associated phospholipid phosphatase
MKIQYTLSAVILVCLFVFIGCEEKTIEVVELQPYAPAQLDTNAGNWQPFVVPFSDVTVVAPADISSNEYQQELAAVKALNPNEAQQQAIKFWGAGGVIRWNEIARELAAAYNIPPNYDENGKYPNPDPANPLKNPRYPFANPPYASRAFALLTIAQYDALVATSHFRQLYGRTAPYALPNGSTARLPQIDAPSYPSEDAVVAAASREILKFLFPGEVPLLTQKSDEHKNSRLWAGMNVQSDIDAGEALGKAVADKIIAYAKTDGMGAANNQPGYQNQIADAKARGIGRIWTSREVPPRPPMLPAYGNVKTWNFTAEEKIAMRTAIGPPPTFESAEFKQNLDELIAIAKDRSREQVRIASYWADGAGTYTPPGHWNRKAAALTYANKFSEVRTARALALLNSAMQDAGICCWDVKYYYLVPRPSEVNAEIKTSTGIPNFPAYTSGHSTFSGAAAEVLSYIFPNNKSEFDAMATEASVSRIYGGIHYRFDCEKGLEHGKMIGAHAVKRGQGDKSGL